MAKISIPEGAEADVTLIGGNGWKVTVHARLDTGASMSSIDEVLAESLGMDVVGEVTVRNSIGSEKRDIVSSTIIYNGSEYECQLNTADRSRLKFPLLLGRDFLFAE
jgi:hypothetical protein